MTGLLGSTTRSIVYSAPLPYHKVSWITSGEGEGEEVTNAYHTQGEGSEVWRLGHNQ